MTKQESQDLMVAFANFAKATGMVCRYCKFARYIKKFGEYNGKPIKRSGVGAEWLCEKERRFFDWNDCVLGQGCYSSAETREDSFCSDFLMAGKKEMGWRNADIEYDIEMEEAQNAID